MAGIENQKLNDGFDIDEFCTLCDIKKESLDSKILELGIIEYEVGLDIFLAHIDELLVNFDMSGAQPSTDIFDKKIKILCAIYNKILESSERKMGDFRILERMTLELQEQFSKQKDYVAHLEDLLKDKDEEIDFLKRKHELMWGKINSELIKKND